MLQALFINNSVLWLEKMLAAELHLAGVLSPVLLWDPSYEKMITDFYRPSIFVSSRHSGNILSIRLLR